MFTCTKCGEVNYPSKTVKISDFGLTTSKKEKKLLSDFGNVEKIASVDISVGSIKKVQEENIKDVKKMVQKQLPKGFKNLQPISEATITSDKIYEERKLDESADISDKKVKLPVNLKYWKNIVTGEVKSIESTNLEDLVQTGEEKIIEEKKQRTRRKPGGKRRPKQSVIDQYLQSYLDEYSTKNGKKYEKVKIDNLLIHGYNAELKNGFILTSKINYKKNKDKVEFLNEKYALTLDLIDISKL